MQSCFRRGVINLLTVTSQLFWGLKPLLLKILQEMSAVVSTQIFWVLTSFFPNPCDLTQLMPEASMNLLSGLCILMLGQNYEQITCPLSSKYFIMVSITVHGIFKNILIKFPTDKNVSPRFKLRLPYVNIKAENRR